MKKSFLAQAVSTGIAGLTLTGVAQADFVEDSKLTFSARNFYYNQDIRNEDRPRLDEWGQAFMLNFKSGYTEGVVGFGLDVVGMYGLRLDAGGSNGDLSDKRWPGSVFPLESNGEAKKGFGKVGVTGKIRFAKTEALIGALRPRNPVVIANDGRLLPQMYQGAQVTSKDLDGFTFTAGKLEHSMERNSSDSDSLSMEGSNNMASALHQDSNEFYYGGVDFQATKDLKLQYYFGQLRDFYKQHFLGLIHNWKLPVGSLETDLRYFYSDSDGENSSASGRAKGYRANGSWSAGSGSRYEVDNQLWSAMFTYKLKGHSLGAGYQKITGNSDFPHLNQGGGRVLHLITNAQVHKFHNAGENTWVAKYAYDFGAIGIPGLKAGINYFSGDDIDVASGSDRSEWERDTRIDYAFQEGMLKGVSLTGMFASCRGNDVGQRDLDEARLIVNYSVALF